MVRKKAYRKGLVLENSVRTVFMLEQVDLYCIQTPKPQLNQSLVFTVDCGDSEQYEKKKKK